MDNSINIALSRLSTQQNALDVIAGNLANASSPGYKTSRLVFANWLVSEPSGAMPRGDQKLAFAQARATYSDHTEGSISHTGNQLDLALGGDGYFTVQTPNGVRLTRAGRFSMKPDGTVTDESGNALLDVNRQPVRLSVADTVITVKADGTLSSQNGTLAQIAVVIPNDPNRLTAEGGRLLRPDVPTTPAARPQVIQGAVEDSNVKPISEINRMIQTERDYQFVAQFAEAEGQRKQTAIDKIAAPVTT